jgi:hypothetical protein
MPDIDSRTELRSIDQKSDTKELLGHYNYSKIIMEIFIQN